MARHAWWAGQKSATPTYIATGPAVVTSPGHREVGGAGHAHTDTVVGQPGRGVLPEGSLLSICSLH